jgi:hypothetical protein
MPHYESADEVTLTPGLRKVIYQILATGGREAPDPAAA